jgi:O-antigen chain-terminating methyltransferase
VAELARRVARLEDIEGRRRFRPFYGQERFEDAFRGTRSDLLDRYRDLATNFAGCSPVLDLGCGRGELLELLAESGVVARGVDLDGAVVEASRRRGFSVIEGDALDVLAAEQDSGLGGVALIQVVEHLTPQEVVDVIALAYDKLRAGGRLVIETVNPRALYVFANAFFVDPTHDRPIHPDYLDFLCREAGFTAVEIQWRSPAPAGTPLEEPDGDEVAVANTRRLNGLLYGPQDYAVVATR